MNIHGRAAEYIEIAKSIEARYGVPVYVIRKNPRTQGSIPWVTSGDGLCIYVVESQHSKDQIAAKAHAELSMKGITVRQTYPIDELIEIAKQRPDTLRSWTGGLSVLPPLMFNEPIYGKEIVRSAVRQLKKAFGAELQQVIRQRIKGFHESRRAAVEAEKAKRRQHQERADKLVGPIERKELTHAIMEMAKKVSKDENPMLVAFDRSGRPIGIMLRHVLREAFGLRVPLYFVDPTVVKRGIKEDAHSKFEKEYPGLVKRIPSSTVVLVDDQIWQGNSLQEMQKIVDHYKPKKGRALVLSQFPVEPAPSWRHRNVLGVETLETQFQTRRSKDKQEEVSAFRHQLKRVAHGAARRIQRNRK